MNKQEQNKQLVENTHPQSEECPVCLEEKHIDELFSGGCPHNLCEKCFDRVNKCPICRFSYFY